MAKHTNATAVSVRPPTRDALRVAGVFELGGGSRSWG